MPVNTVNHVCGKPTNQRKIKTKHKEEPGQDQGQDANLKDG